MIAPDRLNVWYGQTLVGFVWQNSIDQIGFSYSETWLAADDCFPVSISLPLQQEAFTPESGIAHRFFANLLPEARARDQLVRDLKVSDSDFVLLRAIGGECAGALSLLRAEETPTTEHSYCQLSETDFAELIKRKGRFTREEGSQRPRISLAGAQNKIPIFFKDNTYWWPENESLSSHIIKFESSDYRHLPAYETFTTYLANTIGLKVVEIKLRFSGDKPFALISRYDRAVNEQGKIERYHQEDFCQALGYGHQHKYQEYGGPSFADCYRLLANVSTTPTVDTEQLLRWQIFNVLAGNSDGHAKNLSFLYLPSGEITLAPFYDLICTRALAPIDESLAFSIGGERNPNLINAVHWDTLAKSCNVAPRYIRGLIKDIAESLLETITVARIDFEGLYGDYKSLARIEKIVKTQCKRVLEEKDK